MTQTAPTIGERIAAIRGKLGVSQKALAERLEGASRDKLAQIEIGRHSPSLDLLEKLVCDLNTTYEYLIQGTGPMFVVGRTITLEDIEQNRPWLLPYLRSDSEDDSSPHPNPHLNPHLIAENKTKRTLAESATEVADLHGVGMGGGLAAYVSGAGIRPVVATVDAAGRDNITLVDQRASAGYLTGYADPEFIKTLPAFQLPGFSGRTYRAFQVVGHSMHPTIHSGDLVLTSYVENWRHLRDGRVYILITRTEGVTIKRLYNYLQPDGSGHLLCEPDNEDFRPFRLEAPEIQEIWQFEARLTFELSAPGRDLEKRVVTLENTVADLIENREVRPPQLGA